MKHILLAIFAAAWMLGGCNSNTKNNGACTNYDNQTLCSQATYNNSGCFWNNSKACAAALDCGQPTTKSACEASSQAGTQCTWDGSACFLKTSASSKCSDFASKDNCLGTWAGDGYCSWNATSNSCSIAASCSDIQDQAVCSGATVASKACVWTPNDTACQPNSPSICSQNKQAKTPIFSGSFCCAGSDETCIETDPSCPDFGGEGEFDCLGQKKFTCTLDNTDRYCCSGSNTACTSTNPNCTFVATAGSCS